MFAKKEKLIAALSGGVDSSVAAYLCQQKGYEIIGVTLKMRSCDSTSEKTKSCCGLDDNIQARLVAQSLGIPHYFLDARAAFKKEVLARTWNEYSNGRTPSPCIMCNYYIKFGALLDFAFKIGAKGIITGHYARLERDENGNTSVFQGTDTKKDQTYFLSFLTQKQFNHSYMPLGNMTKPEVRRIADKLNLPNAQKQESQDACFGYVGESFAETLSNIYETKMPHGKIITSNGEVKSEHNGIHKFTIGQRKGLGIALGKPAYVLKIDKTNNNVIVTTNPSDLNVCQFTAKNINWLKKINTDTLKCSVQIRYNQNPVLANVIIKTNNTAEISFLSDVRAVTPGQAVVFYQGTQLIAGGWIDKILSNTRYTA